MQGVRTFVPGTPVILLTAYGSVPGAVQAIREGRVRLPDRSRCRSKQLEAAAERFLEPREVSRRDSGAAMSEGVGASASFCSGAGASERVARTDADVLIEAESGTGKELVARLDSSREPSSEWAVCGGQLLGFSGQFAGERAVRPCAWGFHRRRDTAKPGKFELADGGTLLLDEIGEMPVTLAAEVIARVARARDRPAGRHPAGAGGCAR